MDAKHLQTLEYHRILERMAAHTSFSFGRERALSIQPTTDLEEARRLLRLTGEARLLLDTKGTLSIGGARDVRPLLSRAERHATLDPQELLDIKETLVAGRALRRSLSRMGSQVPMLAQKASLIEECAHIAAEIARCINDRGEVMDSASAKLARLRAELKIAHDRLLDKLNRIIGNSDNAAFLQETLVTQRGGRYVIPLKAEFKGRIQGLVHDQSGSGATLFIEPLATVELNNAWRELQLEEEREVRRILMELTDLVAEESPLILRTLNIVAELDVIFAKAKYAEQIRATEPTLVEFAPKPARSDPQGGELPPHPGSRIRLMRARHPLLAPETVVPIDVVFTDGFFVLVITGPNTGGKTVSLKTVGLLALMAQSGLHLPAADGCELSIFQNVFADIGDEQSIEQSLSTFSSHLGNIVDTLKRADSRSLVLLDEIGAGTDPVEGSALARAILSHLVERRITTMATTHYSELKYYAQVTPGVENASVEFDVETLSPTFELTIGLPGRSNAFAIASRLGLPAEIVQEGRSLVAPETLEADVLLGEIQVAHRESQAELQTARAARQELQQLQGNMQKQVAEIEASKVSILAQAREEMREELETFQRELKRARRQIDRGGPLPDAVAEAEQIAQALEAVMPPAPPPPPPEFMPGELRVGSSVWVKSLKAVGEVAAMDGDKVEVSLGRFRLSVDPGDLEIRASPVQEAARVGASEYAPQMQPTRHVKTELDLRGWRVEETLAELDRYLNDAFLMGLPWVRIIHGKGTGVLRQVVREALAGHPLVAKYMPGKPEEGGDGVTVAELAKR
jgi:DNA mismatch repair protein MutS2